MLLSFSKIITTWWIPMAFGLQGADANALPSKWVNIRFMSDRRHHRQRDELQVRRLSLHSCCSSFVTAQSPAAKDSNSAVMKVDATHLANCRRLNSRPQRRPRTWYFAFLGCKRKSENFSSSSQLAAIELLHGDTHSIFCDRGTGPRASVVRILIDECDVSMDATG